MVQEKQVFEVLPMWCRYVRFNVLTRWGNEHHCALTSVGVYGDSLVEDLVSWEHGLRPTFFALLDQRHHTTWSQHNNKQERKLHFHQKKGVAHGRRQRNQRSLMTAAATRQALSRWSSCTASVSKG